MSLCDESGVSSRMGAAPWKGRRGVAAEREGATGDAGPMGERSDAARRSTEATWAPIAPRPHPPDSVGDTSVSAPASALGAFFSRQSTAGRASGTVSQILLGLVCGGYAVGAAFGWGSSELALVMGDFGLSAAALIAAVSCFLYARFACDQFRPAWLLFSLSSLMAAGGNAVWGWYEVVLGVDVPSPSCGRRLLPLLRAARHRRAARARQAPCHQGRLALSGAGLLADRRIAPHTLLEPGARPHGASRRRRGGERGPTRRSRWPIRCSTSCWSPWCSPCTSGGPTPTAPR